MPELIFRGIEGHVVELGCAFNAILLLNHAVEIAGVLAEHGVGEFGVGNLDAQTIHLFVEQSL